MKEEILKRFQYLESLMLLANKVQWLPGISKIIDLLESDEEESLEQAILTYKSMTQGVNSFEDFYFHDNNGKIRVKKNRILEDLKNDIWELIHTDKC